ncbi:protein tesmin/TSO1-like CXC 2 [Senna tora]|uniref:Protein tesmin/TSO1-like CXC 2 n=1 Tax=Senna tora TaxID=362788 RepID=A0A834W5S3_9FABA|nr:protein tesmin/TSO1-like CXC 2 [Senna tora]
MDTPERNQIGTSLSKFEVYFEFPLLSRCFSLQFGGVLLIISSRFVAKGLLTWFLRCSVLLHVFDFTVGISPCWVWCLGVFGTNLVDFDVGNAIDLMLSSIWKSPCAIGFQHIVENYRVLVFPSTLDSSENMYFGVLRSFSPKPGSQRCWSQIEVSISFCYGDSPVFNYINNLSPIKPVKSIHSIQTFNSLNFSSPPSVFTSPHVICPKESRFLRRHNLLDTSKPKVLSEDGKKLSSNEEALADSTHAYRNSSELRGNTDQRIPMGDSSVEPSNENPNFPIELPQTLKYDCGSPGCDPPPSGDETNSLLNLSSKAASDEASKRNSPESVVLLQGICQIEPRNEGPECDWDTLLSDAADLLIFNTPNERDTLKGLMEKSFDPTMHLSNFMSQMPQTTLNNGEKMSIIDPVASGSEHEIEDHHSKPGEINGNDEAQDNLTNAAVTANNPNGTVDNELVSITHHGMRRRCLDFEMVGARRRKSDDGSNNSSTTLQSDKRDIASDKQLLPAKRNGDSQRCILPGIGLHLNALATLKDYKSIKNENMSSGRQLSLPGPASALQLSASQEHHQSLVCASAERDIDPPDNAVQLAEDCSQALACVLEPAGESESCKRCNCKKSKCLKLYCECFAAGVYCIEPCSCQDCYNKPIHEDTVLATRKQIESRNPLAFAPKVIRSSDSVPEIGDDPNKTPASARHKRGCNCKKSNCLKKYCECYQGGVGCSIGCRCEGCKNAYGRKDGSAPIGIEAEPEEEKESSEKAVVEKTVQKPEIQNTEDHPDSSLATTPLRLCRPLLPLSFSSKGKPPRSSFITTIPASGLYAGQKLGKPTILRSQPKFEKQFKTISDDEMPEVLRGDGSPSIKTSSPNGKRISSPNCDFGSSPSRRSGRKLILQSIPSFPSLNPHNL